MLEEQKKQKTAQEALAKAENEEKERQIRVAAQERLELIHRCVARARKVQAAALCNTGWLQETSFRAHACNRHRVWLGAANLASKLWFIADCVKKDREAHPLREQRRRAAIVIATWYKGILTRR